MDFDNKWQSFMSKSIDLKWDLCIKLSLIDLILILIYLLHLPIDDS